MRIPFQIALLAFLLAACLAEDLAIQSEGPVEVTERVMQK